MRPILTRFALALAVSASALCVHAQTVVVLDTLSGGVDLSGSRVAGTNASGGYNARAIPFTAPTGDHRISSADFDFKVIEFAGSPQNFIATFWSDSGGLPDQVLASEIFPGSNTVTSVHVDFENGPDLVSGATYWFGIQPVSGSSTVGRWSSPSDLTTRSLAYSFGSGWTAYVSEYGGAVRISATAIPEPATFGLIGGIIAMLGIVYWKRSQRQS